MRIFHELNQLEMGGAERVVAGIIRHDKKNEHTVFAYKSGPMREVLESAGAKVIVKDEVKEPNLELDMIHAHTGGAESLILQGTKGLFPSIETIHSPVVSCMKDAYVTNRVGVSNVVTKMNRKCQTIYNGVDLGRLPEFSDRNDGFKARYRKEMGIPENAFVIGRIGRIATDKCVEEFLVACWKFQRNHSNADNIHILIGGDATEPGYMSKVKIMAASFPLKNVHFTGEVENVMPVYGSMDVFLYPSPTEGFGLVYVEAMASGVPVIAWDNDVTREILMGSALLTNPSIDGLVNGLVSMYNSESIRHNFGVQGYKTARENFTEDIMSANYQRLYASMEELIPREKHEQCESRV